MPRFKRARAFIRNTHLNIRMNDEDKNRLVQVARTQRRDTSNLAYEFILAGVEKVERQRPSQLTQ